MSVSSKVFEFETTNFLRVYFDFAYFLCLCPFRLVKIRLKDESFQGNAFQVKSWWLQKLCCATITLLGFPWLLRDNRLSISEGNKLPNFSKNPTVYFEILLSLLGSLVRLSVIQVFWGKGDELCKTVNFLAKQSQQNFKGKQNYLFHGQKTRIKLSNKLVICLVCFMYTGVGFFNLIIGRSLSEVCHDGTSVSKWNINWWWTAVIDASKYGFFMQSKNVNASILVDQECTQNSDAQNMPLSDTLLGVVGSVGFYFKRVLGSHYNCFQLMAILTLWTCVKKFSHGLSRLYAQPSTQLLNSDSKSRLLDLNKSVLQSYLALKELSKLLNSVYGTNITLFLVEAVLYYAVSLDKMFVERHGQGRDFIKMVLLFFYFGSTCLVLLVTADISKQMSCFKEWLLVPQNHENIPTGYLYILMNELDTNAVSIKASNVFPVTYVLAAKLLGVTVTYFIICVQD